MFDTAGDDQLARTAQLRHLARAIAATGPEPLTPEQLQSGLRDLEAARAALDAAIVGWTTALHTTGAVAADTFLRSQLRVAPRELQRRRRAADLFARSPAAADALAAGAISAEHVDALAHEAGNLPDTELAALADRAATTSVEELRDQARRAAMIAAGDDGKAEAARQCAAVSARFGRDRDGMITLHARFDPASGDTVRTGLHHTMDQLWRAQHPQREPVLADRPPYEQRLGESLVAMAQHRGGHGRATRTRKPTVMVLIDYQTLTDGLRGDSTCHTDWGTPLAPDTVRRMACDAGIIPVVLGARGEVLDIGRLSRVPTTAQRAAVIARDRHCTHPGCDTPAAWCDIHHLIDWYFGGHTNLTNLTLRCHRHHTYAHEGHPPNRAGP